MLFYDEDNPFFPNDTSAYFDANLVAPKEEYTLGQKALGLLDPKIQNAKIVMLLMIVARGECSQLAASGLARAEGPLNLSKFTNKFRNIMHDIFIIVLKVKEMVSMVWPSLQCTQKGAIN